MCLSMPVSGIMRAFCDFCVLCHLVGGGGAQDKVH